MLYIDEFKEAIDKGYILGDTVAIVRKNGQIFDYVLPHEEDKRFGGCNRGKSGRSVDGIVALIGQKSVKCHKNLCY